MSAGERDPSVADLRRTVHDQLARAERLIQTLTRDLEAERERGRDLARERDQLLVALARADATRVQLREHKERLERTLVDLDHERRRLAEANVQLRADRDAEREGAAQEIHCLEAQIEELSAMVELLSNAREIEAG